MQMSFALQYAARWHTASAQHSGAQELRPQQRRQGSSWVSGLIVRCPPAKNKKQCFYAPSAC